MPTKHTQATPENRQSTPTELALIRRIRRKLSQDNKRLVRPRENTWERVNFGEWYVFDLKAGAASSTHCKLEELARELGVKGGDL